MQEISDLQEVHLKSHQTEALWKMLYYQAFDMFELIIADLVFNSVRVPCQHYQLTYHCILQIHIFNIYQTENLDRIDILQKKKKLFLQLYKCSPC